jgi:deoxyadenosine/deoxycytidine kinase
MAKVLVLIAGNIASGKTSLTERLGQRLHWRTGFESVDENPYLPDFYANMTQWAFHLQIYFLGQRAEQYAELAAGEDSAILERSIYEDAAVFAPALHASGDLSDRDYRTYRRLFDQVAWHLPRPDLLIYLHTPVPVLQERIRRRGRPMEQGITADYLRRLEGYYEQWMGHFDLCPLLAIESAALDFVHDPADMERVVQRIEAILHPRENIQLP